MGENTILQQILDKMGGIEGKVSGIEGKVSGIENKVTGIEDKVSGIEDKVSGIEDKVSGIEKKLDEHDLQFAGLKMEMNEVKETVDHNFELLQKVSIRMEEPLNNIEALEQRVWNTEKGIHKMQSTMGIK